MTLRPERRRRPLSTTIPPDIDPQAEADRLAELFLARHPDKRASETLTTSHRRRTLPGGPTEGAR